METKARLLTPRTNRALSRARPKAEFAVLVCREATHPAIIAKWTRETDRLVYATASTSVPRSAMVYGPSIANQREALINVAPKHSGVQSMVAHSESRANVLKCCIVWLTAICARVYEAGSWHLIREKTQQPRPNNGAYFLFSCRLA